MPSQKSQKGAKRGRPYKEQDAEAIKKKVAAWPEDQDDETAQALARFPPPQDVPAASEEEDEGSILTGDSDRSEDEGEEEEGDDDQEEEEEEEDGVMGEDDEYTKGDGMADMMSKILGQKVQDVKAPVLAKHKTKLMREAEAEKQKEKEERKAAAEKRAKLDHQFYIPSHNDIEPEKQLRRVATRGVVALFNAITQARAQAEAYQENTGKVAGGKKGDADISKKQFLEMLKNSTKKGASSPAAPASKRPDAPAGEDGGAKWAAVDDDYMMAAGKMQFWKDGDEDEGGDEDDDAQLMALGEVDSEGEGGDSQQGKASKSQGAHKHKKKKAKGKRKK